jgi:hypothetical protein
MTLPRLALDHSFMIDWLPKSGRFARLLRPLALLATATRTRRSVRADWTFLRDMFLYSRSQSRKNNRISHA